MGNHRKEISQKTVGCPVISIGVPTVIDSRTLILEAAENIEGWNSAQGRPAQEDGCGLNAQTGAPGGQPQGSGVEKYLESRDFDMIVTSTDIDEIIKDFSDIIANAINITLHPGIYSQEK